MVGPGSKNKKETLLKRSSKKLTLSRETLRSLEAPQLRDVAGGWPIGGVKTYESCNQSCYSDTCRTVCYTSGDTVPTAVSCDCDTVWC